MTESIETEIVRKKLDYLCRQVIKEKGWRPFNDLSVTVEEDSSTFAAYITLDERKIHILTGKDILTSTARMIEKEKINIPLDGAIEKIVYLLMVHEYGHHQHCPINNENFKLILEGHFEAIEGREYRKDRIIGLCLELHNMFSDTILNSINAQTDENAQKYRDGLDLVYLVDVYYNKMKRGKGMDKAHTLFLKSNKILCSTSPEISERMNKYYARFFWGGQRHLKKVIDVFTGDENLTSTVIEGKIDVQARTDLVYRLQDTTLWKDMAYKYANILYPYLRQKQNWLDNSFTKSNKPKQSGQGQQQKPNQGGQGQKPQPSQPQTGQGGGQDDNKKDKKKNKGNTSSIGGDKKDKDKNSGKNKDDIKDNKGGMSDLLNDLLDNLLGPHIPYSSPYLQNFDLLDKLYTERAGRVGLFVEGENNDNPQHEQYLSKEEMPLEEFMSKGIDWSSTRILTKNDGDTHLELYKGDMPLILPFESNNPPGGIPDLAFIIDSSISMDFDPFTGDGKGNYHFACLGVYSILKFLNEIGLAPLLNYYLINFSNKTVASGWRPHSEINRVKQTLFDYQSSGTILDPKAIEHLRNTRRDNFITFMLADGEFNFEENQKEVIKEIELLREIGGIGFYLFQIGEHSSFSKELEDKGFPVQLINSAEDFRNKSIKFTRDFYGEVAKNVNNL